MRCRSEAARRKKTKLRSRSSAGLTRIQRHSLTMLERIATACGVGLKLHAEKKPNFDREVARSNRNPAGFHRRTTCIASRTQYTSRANVIDERKYTSSLRAGSNSRQHFVYLRLLHDHRPDRNVARSSRPNVSPAAFIQERPFYFVFAKGDFPCQTQHITP